MNEDFPTWNMQRMTRCKFGHSDFRTRYKAIRNSSSAFIKRPDVRRFIFNKNNNQCVLCGSFEHLQIDHIISVYRTACYEFDIEKLNTKENLQTVCSSCNARKAP